MPPKRRRLDRSPPVRGLAAVFALVAAIAIVGFWTELSNAQPVTLADARPCVQPPGRPCLPAGARSAVRPSGRQPGHRLYWGAWIGAHLTGRQAPWDHDAVVEFERRAGKSLSILNFSSPFMDCSTDPCAPYPFPLTPFRDIRAHGAIPMFSWNSAALPVTKRQPDFQLRDVISGSYDAYITEWATAAARWGHPFFLRFNWEMNMRSHPWAEAANGNVRGDYARAWRHVHSIFTRVGAHNATWVWCPNIDPRKEYTSLPGLYPGDAYVDWTCLDGYAWDGTSESFSSLYRRSYDEITRRIAPRKPMMIGEVGAPEDGGKDRWIADMFATLERMPRIRALVWFEKYADGQSWPIGTSRAAQSAFRAGIASPRYIGATFSDVERSPIPAP